MNSVARLLVGLLSIAFVTSAVHAAEKPYQVGVYYFPGWKDGASADRPFPWSQIKPFPEREPMLGWYQEGKPEVTETHLQWMHAYGIDFVAYDWYWNVTNHVRLNQALDAYLLSKGKKEVQFALLWANHTEVPKSLSQFDVMVDYWLKYYFTNASYLRKNGEPVVFVFSPSRLNKNASGFGETGASLLKRARDKARQAGLPGIYFVGSVQANKGEIRDTRAAGYDALSAYNYHHGPTENPKKPIRSRNYTELTADYAENWRWILNRVNVPYFVPTTAGWDARPWAKGKKDPHNGSAGNPELFRRHLQEAKSLIDQNSSKTDRTVMICCWNEFGEGSYIEPTKKDGFAYLRIVKDIFGNK